MSGAELGMVHRFLPAPAGQTSTRTLLLLHGTGGDESDLLPLGRALDPQAALLSPRGNVLEGSMPRFFRRLAEGVFDIEDLTRRTHELAAFVSSATSAYGRDPAGVVAVGFSNGANIAGSLLLLHPGTLRAAALLRPMVPIEPDPLPDLHGTSVLVAAGRADPIVPRSESERLRALLERCGAEVEVSSADAGHGLTQADIGTVKAWLGRLSAAGVAPGPGGPQAA
jgi:predicted esterase